MEATKAYKTLIETIYLFIHFYNFKVNGVKKKKKGAEKHCSDALMILEYFFCSTIEARYLSVTVMTT